jgi:hypothetical protein
VSLVELVAFDDEVGLRVDEVDDEDEEEEEEDDEDEELLLLPEEGVIGTMACAVDSRPSCRTSAPRTARRGLRTEGILRDMERIGPTEASVQVDRVPEIPETSGVFRGLRVLCKRLDVP